jgi:two-component system nitrogen regulation response regulator GlnG
MLLAGEVDIFKDYTHIVEKELIAQALKHTKGRRVDAAKLLGVGRNTITRKIKELEIKVND